MKKYILLFIILTELSSCLPKEEIPWYRQVSSVQDILDAFDLEIEGKGEIYIDDSTVLMKPFSIKIINEFMFIDDAYDGLLFSIYDMEEEKFARRFLQNGRGPGEFAMGGALPISYGKDSVLILDVRKNTGYIYSLQEILEDQENIHRLVHFKNRTADKLRKVFYINENLIGGGDFSHDVLLIYDKLGNPIYSFGHYPKVNSQDKMELIHLADKYAFRTNIAYSKKEQKLIVSYNDALFYYDYSNGNPKLDFQVQWEMADLFVTKTGSDGRPRVATMGNETSKVGAGVMTSNEKFVFIPISTKTRYEVDFEGVENKYNYILVFNWEGDPVCKIKLDKPIKPPLEIGSSGQYLYSLHTDLNSGLIKIIRYDISQIKK